MLRCQSLALPATAGPRDINLPYDLARAPAWRWAWAKQACQVTPTPRSPDPACSTALRLIRLQEGGHSVPVRCQAAVAAASWAYQCVQAGGMSCWELEARLLARQSPRAIAQALHLPPGHVRAFHDLFYDVRSRLQYPEVMGALLARGEADPPEPAEVRFLKEFALRWRVPGVEAALRWWHAPPVLPPWGGRLPAAVWEDLWQRWQVEIHYLAHHLTPGASCQHFAVTLRTTADLLRRDGMFQGGLGAAALAGLAVKVGQYLPELGRPYALIPPGVASPGRAGTAVVLAGASSAG